MAKSFAKNFDAKKLTHAIDQCRSDNPVLVRKKFQMKDVYFRRNTPDAEIFHIDVGFDVELGIMILLLAAVSFLLLLKISRTLSDIRLRRRLAASLKKSES